MIDIEEIELQNIKDFSYGTNGETYDGGRKILEIPEPVGLRV